MQTQFNQVLLHILIPNRPTTAFGYSPGAHASAELAASRTSDKYANLPNSYIFQPIAFENVDTLNSSAVALISALGRMISTKSNDLRD